MPQTRMVQKPACSANQWINLAAAASGVAVYALLKYLDPALNQLIAVLAGLTAILVPLAALEVLMLKVHRRPSTGLCPAQGPSDLKRVAVKYTGLLATFVLLGAYYWLLPEYRGNFYNYYFLFLVFAAGSAVLFGWLYLSFMDARLVNPQDDGFWHLGCFVLGRWRGLNWPALLDHCRLWAVKAFFLPLMFGWIIQHYQELSYAGAAGSAIGFLTCCAHLALVVDLLYPCLAYMFTTRWLDSHVRSVEPTLLGWLVCLPCYTFIFWEYMGYFPKSNIEAWFGGKPLLLIAFSALALSFQAVMVLGSLALGHRAVNLTYRGLISSGPYRYSKHPIYIAKVINWFLLIPFLPDDSLFEAARSVVLLCLVACVYYLRARTEENHLSNYPEYVEYANWMNEHGLLSSLGRRFPLLQYSEDRARAWGAVVWWRKRPPRSNP